MQNKFLRRCIFICLHFSERFVPKKPKYTALRNLGSFSDGAFRSQEDKINHKNFFDSNGKILKKKKNGRHIKEIVSRDWKGLQMVSFDRFEV
jgi:hypothetical protein